MSRQLYCRGSHGHHMKTSGRTLHENQSGAAKHGEVASNLEGCAKICPQGTRRALVNDLLPPKERENIIRAAMPHILSLNAAITININPHISPIILKQLVLQESTSIERRDLQFVITNEVFSAPTLLTHLTFAREC